MNLNEHSEFHQLIKALSYVRTHWWLFLIEIALLMGWSSYRYFRAPSVYESGASLLIDSSRRAVAQSVIPGLGTPGQSSKRQNIYFLLTSQETFDRVRTTLIDFYNAEGRPAYLRPYFPNGTAIAGNGLKGSIFLNWDKNSDIYYLRCTGGTAQAAYALCVNYLNAVQTFYPEIGQRETMLKRDFITRQIKSYTRQIQEGVARLNEFQRRSTDFIEFVVKGLDVSSLGKLKEELNTLKKKNDANRKIRSLLLSSPASKRGELLAASGAIDALSVQVTELKYQIELTRNSKQPDRAARVRALEAELARNQAQLGQLNEEEVQATLKNPLPSSELRKKISELELDYKTNIVTIASIERQIAQLKENEIKFQPQRIEHERLNSEIEQRRALLNTLYLREQETELELASGGAEVFRLAEPYKPGDRVSPQFTSYFFSGVSACLFVLGLSVLTLMIFFPRLDSEAEVARLNLPILGKVPNMALPSGGGIDEIPSGGFEYLRIMNYRILRETKDIRCPVVVISSSNSREGKSTIVQLMALASQAPGRKTLLIDGDLLTFHPNRFFNIEEDFSEGVRGILENKGKGNTGGLTTKTIHEGVFLLPRGGRIEPSVSPNFLDPLKQQLEVWRREYNLILIDTPPLFAANLAHQWTSLSDLIILVARLYVTRPKDILESLATCKVYSKSPIGIALNCVPITGPARNASYYYFSKRKTRPTRLAS